LKPKIELMVENSHEEIVPPISQEPRMTEEAGPGNEGVFDGFVRIIKSTQATSIGKRIMSWNQACGKCLSPLCSQLKDCQSPTENIDPHPAKNDLPKG
jgi:hypothetical protein